MKYAAAIILSTALVGCVTPAQADKDAAWAKCEKLVDKASRSSCMTNALSEANSKRRAEELTESKRRAEETQTREREEALEQAYGLPEKQQGAVIIREPFE